MRLEIYVDSWSRTSYGASIGKKWVVFTRSFKTRCGHFLTRRAAVSSVITESRSGRRTVIGILCFFTLLSAPQGRLRCAMNVAASHFGSHRSCQTCLSLSGSLPSVRSKAARRPSPSQFSRTMPVVSIQPPSANTPHRADTVSTSQSMSTMSGSLGVERRSLISRRRPPPRPPGRRPMARRRRPLPRRGTSRARRWLRPWRGRPLYLPANAPHPLRRRARGAQHRPSGRLPRTPGRRPPRRPTPRNPGPRCRGRRHPQHRPRSSTRSPPCRRSRRARRRV